MTKKKKLIIIILAFILAVCLYPWVEPFWLSVKAYEIRHRDVPASFDGYSIIFLTDIHRGPYFSEKRVSRLVNRVNRLKADIILLGGDYVQHVSPEYAISCFRALKGLEAPDGKFGVLGNHDYWLGEELVRQEMNHAGLIVLDNEKRLVVKGNETITIGGLEDLYEGKPDIAPITYSVKEEDFLVVVSHNPDVIETEAMEKVDLLLSGHTHGGQVTLFGLWAPLVPSNSRNLYRTGRINKENTTLIVSNGIGTVTPPVRFFARPQIVKIVLKKE